MKITIGFIMKSHDDMPRKMVILTELWKSNNWGQMDELKFRKIKILFQVPSRKKLGWFKEVLLTK